MTTIIVGRSPFNVNRAGFQASTPESVSMPRGEAADVFKNGVVEVHDMQGMRVLLSRTKETFRTELTGLINSGAGDLFGHFGVSPRQGKRGTQILGAEEFLNALIGICPSKEQGFFRAAMGISEPNPYYCGKEEVGKILLAVAGLRRRQTPLELYPFDFSDENVVYGNGMEINGERYLNEAALYLGIATSKDDLGKSLRETLYKLLSTAGYTIRDGAYYRDRGHVVNDLDKICQKLGIDSPDALTVEGLMPIKFKCDNGERVHGNVYVFDAAIYLLEASVMDANAMSKSALVKLVEIYFGR